ncbi:unnamed protein product [Agarophyton chilense]
MPNDWHFSSGSVHSLDAAWSAGRRIIGLYWSPKEIRFLIDGVEVQRIRNTIIHQPMLFDLSYSYNVQWAQQTPTSPQIEQPFEILYVRRWDVYTADGLDPPSSLALNEKMSGFDNRYGEQLLGMFQRFPTNDDNTFSEVFAERDTIEQIQDSIPSNAESSSRTLTSLQSRLLQSDEAMLRTGEMDYLLSERLVNETLFTVRQGKKLKKAGGVGNKRFSKARGKLNAAQRRIALSYASRSAAVTNGKAALLQDPETTVFEFANPHSNGAGWATRDGLGTDSSVA